MGKRKLGTTGDKDMLNSSGRIKSQKVSHSTEESGSKKETKGQDPAIAKHVESLVNRNHSSGSTIDSERTDSAGLDLRRADSGAKTDVDEPEGNEEEKKEHPVIDVTEPRLTDILLIEHAVKNLQTSIDSIIHSSPDEEGLKKMQSSVNDDTNPQLTAALQRYKMKLGAELKTLHSKGELKIFDQILNYEKLKDALEAPKPLIFAPQYTTDNDETKSQTSSAASSFSSTSAVSSTSSSFSASQNSGLPPIPEIKDPAIRARVFIHKSLIKDKLFLSKREQLHSHNERLEFLGDSVLNNMMTQIAYHRFPDAAEGYLSVLRTKLISNATLMKWSSAYGLDKELKKNTSEDTLNLGKMKLFADVFEAYVGGLMTEDPANYPVVYEWLKQLAEPILVRNEPKKETRSEFRPNAKMELYSLIGSASLGLHYDCVYRNTNKQPATFVVELRTGAGDLLGKGTGENIKIAGTKAAMEALDDKELIEKYSLIRANTPRDTSKVPSQELQKSRESSTAAEKKGPSNNRPTGPSGVTSLPAIPVGPSASNPRRDYRGSGAHNGSGFSGRPKGPAHSRGGRGGYNDRF